MSATTARMASHAEVLKLARLLETKPDSLQFLLAHDALAVRALREQMTAQLYDDRKALLQKMAVATKLTPTSISALIAEKALGPLLCARVASLLPPEKAIEIAKRLSAEFLAEVCLHLDPRRAAAIIRGTSVTQVVQVARILQAQREYVTMARFVDVLAPEAIKAVIAATPDEATLLRTAVFAENPAVHNELVSYLPAPRLQRLMTQASTDAELWAAALNLLSHLDARWQKELGQLIAAFDEATLERALRYTQAQELWSVLLPVLAVLSVPARKRVLSQPAAQTPAMQAAIAAATLDTARP